MKPRREALVSSEAAAFADGYEAGQRAAQRNARKLFDACIDCLYEYDLASELPKDWPPEVRKAIEASRKRIARTMTTAE